MKNHPHDSICGCSIDEVHRLMMSRFDRVLDSGEQMMREHMVNLTPTFARKSEDDGATTLCVINPLPAIRSVIVERLVVLPAAIDIKRLRLWDQEGQEVPFAVVDHNYVERFWGVDYRVALNSAAQLDTFQNLRKHFGPRIIRSSSEQGGTDCYLTLHFLAEDLPPVGHRPFYLREDSTDEENAEAAVDVDPNDVRVSDDSLENATTKVTLYSNGTFDLLDKESGHHYRGLNLLEDTEDIGDEYDYASARSTQTLRSDQMQGVSRIVRNSRFWSQIEVAFDWNLPRAIEQDRSRRSEQLVGCHVKVCVGLKKDSRLVEVEVCFDNGAEDHRLRAVFPSGVSTDTVVSDGHFYLNRRPIEKPSGDMWKQPPPTTYPQQDFSCVQSQGRGLALLNKGLPEFEASRDEHGDVTLSLTLLRSVGWLSRDDLETRRCENAGPTVHTPEAQCLGAHRFEYALLPYPEDDISAAVKEQSQMYRVPVMTVQGVEDGHRCGAEGLVQKTSSKTSISAIKQHDLRDTLEIRLYNLTDERVEDQLILGRPVEAAWLTDLLGERLSPLLVDGGRNLELSFGPHDVLTVEVNF